MAGDALNAESVRTLCHKARTIYHCVNVPYQQWSEVMPKVTENILASAKEAQATVVFPGNVYRYGRFQHVPATEDHPRAATSKKGKLRNAIEEHSWTLTSQEMQAWLFRAFQTIMDRM